MKDLWSRLHGIAVSRTPLQLVGFALTPLAVLAAAWWLLRPPAAPTEAGLPMAVAATVPATSGPAPVPAPTSVLVPTSGVSAGSGSGPDAAVVVVQIAGAVADPGVYELAAGSRVVDLLAVAGGATADADPQAMSLAAVLVDGQRVVVPKVGEQLSPADLGAVGGSGGAGPGPTVPAGPVNLNTATVEQLDALPGVGPATAAAIVAHRDQHGPFLSVDELLDVRGIGPAKLASIEPLVTL